MVLFLVYWMWSLLSFGTSLRDAMDMHQLYTSRLKISPTDIHNIEWSEVWQEEFESWVVLVPRGLLRFFALLQLFHSEGMGHGGVARAGLIYTHTYEQLVRSSKPRKWIEFAYMPGTWYILRSIYLVLFSRVIRAVLALGKYLHAKETHASSNELAKSHNNIPVRRRSLLRLLGWCRAAALALLWLLLLVVVFLLMSLFFLRVVVDVVGVVVVCCVLFFPTYRETMFDLYQFTFSPPCSSSTSCSFVDRGAVCVRCRAGPACRW